MQKAGALAGKISICGMIGSLLMGVLVGKIRNPRRVSVLLPDIKVPIGESDKNTSVCIECADGGVLL